ncbi:MAG: TraB/GumN family protein [Bacteroidota bacterium]
MKKVKNSKLTLLLAVLAIAISFNCSAQKKQKSLLWKVSGNGIQPSYLMGTFHMLPNEDFEMKKKVKDAFTASEQIVLELDMDDPSMSSKMMQQMMMTDGKTLKDFMTAEEAEFLDKKLTESFGQGLSTLGRMKPLAILSMVTISVMGEQPASFELSFVQMAQKQKKEVLGLETVKEQMQVFEDISYESQLDDIIEMLEDDDATEAYFDKMIATYRSEDLNALMSLMEEYYEGREDEMARLLDVRNMNWIPQIGELAKDKTTFFAVGAGHLPGKKGVIQLLQKAGYKVTPVKG